MIHETVRNIYTNYRKTISEWREILCEGGINDFNGVNDLTDKDK